MDANERKLILESTNYQLMYVLKEIVENKLNENTVNYLEEEYEELSKIDLNAVDDEIFVINAKKTLKLAAETLDLSSLCRLPDLSNSDELKPAFMHKAPFLHYVQLPGKSLTISIKEAFYASYHINMIDTLFCSSFLLC